MRYLLTLAWTNQDNNVTLIHQMFGFRPTVDDLHTMMDDAVTGMTLVDLQTSTTVAYYHMGDIMEATQ